MHQETVTKKFFFSESHA
ncbi:unnamed protein product [Oikopleura dioica]|uniref:Uncharacterized protein n=1 Tax=Oikopleura dioica TaxID=34765 RepID=E4XJ68_OIKDI|nr:unnamed protein product [Oikopleura dioica]